MDQHFTQQITCTYCSYSTDSSVAITEHLLREHLLFCPKCDIIHVKWHNCETTSLNPDNSNTSALQRNGQQRENENLSNILREVSNSPSANFDEVSLDQNSVRQVGEEDVEDVNQQEFEQVFSSTSYRQRRCPICNEGFTYVVELDYHLFSEHPQLFTNVNLVQVGQGSSSEVPRIYAYNQAFNNLITTFRVDLKTFYYKSMKELLADLYRQLILILKKELQWRKGFTLFVNSKVIFKKQVAWSDEELNSMTAEEQQNPPTRWKYTDPPEYINTFKHGIFHESMLRSILHKCASKIDEMIEKFVNNGSGWIVHKIDFLEFVVATYSPFVTQPRTSDQRVVQQGRGFSETDHNYHLVTENNMPSQSAFTHAIDRSYSVQDEVTNINDETDTFEMSNDISVQSFQKHGSRNIELTSPYRPDSLMSFDSSNCTPSEKTEESFEGVDSSATYSLEFSSGSEVDDEQIDYDVPIEFPNFCYLRFPSFINSKWCILNLDLGNEPSTIINNSFVLSVAAHAGLYGSEISSRNLNKLSTLKRILEVKTGTSEQKLNLFGLQCPIYLNQVNTFEKYNTEISINIFGFELKVEDEPKFQEDQAVQINARKERKKYQQKTLKYWRYVRNRIHPLFISNKSNRTTVVDLILLYQGNNAHFVLVKDLDFLLSKPFCRKHYFCRRCLQGFSSCEILSKHTEICIKIKPQAVSFPDCDMLSFCRYDRTIETPFRIYADFEAILKAINCDKEFDRKSNASYTEFKDEHVCCGYAWLVVNSEGKLLDRKVYRGVGAAANFLKDMNRITERLLSRVTLYQQESYRNNSWRTQVNKFVRNSNCSICNQPLSTYDEDTVLHHSHIPVNDFKLQTDPSNFEFRFLGRAHKACNLQARLSSKIPIFFHNMKNYDCSILLQSLQPNLVSKVKVIAVTREKMLSIIINDTAKFIDSCQLLVGSLSALVSSLHKDGASNFKITRQVMESLGGDWKLFLRKGVYPYKLIKSFYDFMSIKEYPTIEKFENDLSTKLISQEEWEHGQNVWNSFNIKNMGEFHDLYVMSDVTLLADVMEARRKVILNLFGLDLTHYLTLPMFAFDACLKFTQQKLEIVKDIDILQFFVQAKRGGICNIGPLKEAVANNRYMGEMYNSSLPTSFIMTYDYTNLYGSTMTEPLPISDFEFVEVTDTMNTAWLLSLSADGEIGFWLEVDLEIPSHLHKKFDNYPLAPEKRRIMYNELSPYQKKFVSPAELSVEKLICDLNTKVKYKVHYRVLQKYIELGVGITKIHRILRFKQKAWIKTFVELCSQIRKDATTEIEKEIAKLIVNSISGKLMEDRSKQRKVVVAMSETRAQFYVKNPAVQEIKIINNSCVMFLLKRVKFIADRPIYGGVTVLDVSKLHMYNFFTITCIQNTFLDQTLPVP